LHNLPEGTRIPRESRHFYWTAAGKHPHLRQQEESLFCFVPRRPLVLPDLGKQEITMMLKRLSLFLLLLLLSACSSSLDERFYGTWISPAGETEPVVFREDGTVSWFGEEGTFESYEYKTGCHPHDLFPCFGGTGRGLKVSASGNTHKIRPNFDTYEDAWWLFPKGDTFAPESSHYGVLLLRSGSFEAPIMPQDFTKLGAGWSLPLNRGYKGSDVYFDSGSEHARVFSVDPLLARRKWDNSVFAYLESVDS